MTTVDLTAPAPAPAGLLDGLPRRLGLTLPELLLAADLTGDAPLPFEPGRPGGDAASPLEDRLGASRSSTDQDAFLATVERLHDPRQSLSRRGLLDGDRLEAGLAGALGLLADPALALDVDLAVTAPGCAVQAKVWQRHRGGAVASLSTVDGVVFELAWFGVDAWPAELARVAVLPPEVEPTASRLPAHLDAPYELLDGVGEALGEHRAELVPVLVGRHPEAVLADGRPVPATDAGALLEALHTEAAGRLRALATRVTADGSAPVGVVSWLLLADGWHALRPHGAAAEARVSVERVSPDHLARALAPVLAVLSGVTA